MLQGYFIGTESTMSDCPSVSETTLENMGKYVTWIQLPHLPLVPLYVSVNRDSIGSDNGLSPERRQAIIWTNAVLLSIGPLKTNGGVIRIQTTNAEFSQQWQKS